MLRDAQLGLLPDLPSDILDAPAPQDPAIWEVSRVFVADTLSSRERMHVRGEIGLNLARLALKWHIDSYLCRVDDLSGWSSYRCRGGNLPSLSPQGGCKECAQLRGIILCLNANRDIENPLPSMHSCQRVFIPLNPGIGRV